VTDGQRETVASATQFVDAQEFSFPVFFDTSGEGSVAYAVNAIPMTVFIDREGNIVATQIGAMTSRELQRGIDLIL